MRSEKEIMDLIINTAKDDERVRAVYMTGSRTNPNVEKDIYQDYDIGYVVTETESFLENKDWVKIFGNISVLEEPDLVDKSLGIEMDFSKSYTWLMLFDDDNRIDLGIETCAYFKEETEGKDMTGLMMPLLDKDGIIPKVGPCTDKEFWVKKPDFMAYRSCCNEYWWCLNNVAKGLARNEIPYAMWMFNSPVRNMLNKMTEWYIGVNNNFAVCPGKQGKFYKEFLPEELYTMYLSTYSDGNVDNIWKAIYESCSLFNKMALHVGSSLNYKYNDIEEKNMLQYMKKVRNN